MKLTFKTIVLIFVSVHLFVTQNAYSQTAVFPFQNEKLSFENRAKDIVSRLTLEEKVAQMMDIAPAIPRLGIPAYNWWNETLHGVARSKDTVTVFPQAIGMAATFNREALKSMGEICAVEARAIYNQALKENKGGERYKGLTFWTPNINIFRDPRWGRGQETYGEDPYLTGQLGIAIVNGLQGNHSKYLKTAACAKHFAIHSGPESTRHTFDVNVSDKDLWETYLPAFKNLVIDAKVSSVMCAYNRFRGEPACGNQLLMVDILRNQWGFNGYVTSDCGAVTDFWKTHKTQPDEKSAAAAAVKKGTDLECGEFWDNHWTYKSLADAVNSGLLDEQKLNESVERLFLTRMRLGMFDKSVPFDKISYSILNKNEHKSHALKMARESMVLLKNNRILPLSINKVKTIAVVGPNANSETVLLGNYNGIPQELITIVKGIQQKVGQSTRIIYEQGVDYTKLLPGKSILDVVEKVKSADVIVFVGGINSLLEGEEGDAGKEEVEGFYKGDRISITLPKIQTELMKSLKAIGKPVVFVNMSGSAMAINWEADNVDAIIQAWYGGQSAGTAIADIIFGDYNPSGKLPLTFYKSEKDLPQFDDYSMSNRTYRYFKGEVLYPFGYGLSFSKFKYNKVQIKKLDSQVEVTAIIKNTGKYDGEDVAQLYISTSNKDGNQPIRSLKGFERVSLKAGEKKEVKFLLKKEDLMMVSDNGERLLYTDQAKITVGGGQPIKSKGENSNSIDKNVKLFSDE
jgi:beta-glucosidase